MAGSSIFLPFEIDGVSYAVPLESVAYIISSSDSFPCCVPPKRNPAVSYVMRVDQDLMAVVELTALEGHNATRRTIQSQRPLILALNCQGSLIGLLADRILPPLELSDPKIETDSLSRQTFLINNGKHFVLFDVLTFYNTLQHI